MVTRSPSSPSEEGSAKTPSMGEGSQPAPVTPRFTRASAVWAATGVALLLLILLIAFMLQNSKHVEVHFVGMSGTFPSVWPC